MDAEYLSYVKSIATFALTFYGYIISVLASVACVPKTKYVYLIKDQTYALCMNGYLYVNHPCTPLDSPII